MGGYRVQGFRVQGFTGVRVNKVLAFRARWSSKVSVLRLRCSFSHLRSRRVVKHWLDKLLGWVVAINPLSFKLALSGVPVPLLGSLWYPSKNMLTYGGGGGYWVLKVPPLGWIRDP